MRRVAFQYAAQLLIDAGLPARPCCTPSGQHVLIKAQCHLLFWVCRYGPTAPDQLLSLIHI